MLAVIDFELGLTNDSGQSLINPNSRQAQVTAGEIVNLEVLYRDLRPGTQAEGAFAIYADIIASNNRVLQPMVGERQVLTFTNNIGQATSGAIRLSYPGGPTVDVAIGEFLSDPALVIRNAISNALEVQTTSDWAIDVTRQGASFAFDIRFSGNEWLGKDVARLNVDTSALRTASGQSIAGTFTELNIRDASGSIRPEYVRELIDTASRSVNGTKVYSSGISGNHNRDYGFTGLGGFSGTLTPPWAAGSQTVTNLFEAFSLRMRVLPSATSLALHVKPNLSDISVETLMYGTSTRLRNEDFFLGPAGHLVIAIGPNFNFLDDSATTLEGTTVAIDVIRNDAQYLGSDVRLVSVDPPNFGASEFTANRIVYHPRPGFFGMDTFRYTVLTNAGELVSATVLVTVTPVDDRPVALDDYFQVTAGTNAILDVLANDSAGIGDAADTLTIIRLDNPFGGGAWSVRSDGRLGFTPPTLAPGTAGATSSADYTIIDSFGATSTAKVSVDTLIPAFVLAQTDSVVINEDTSVTIDVLANDVNPLGGPMHLVSLFAPSHGAATIKDDQVIYSPTPNFFGVDLINYVVNNQHGGTGLGTIQIEVKSVNDPPVAVNDAANVDSTRGEQFIEVLANDLPGVGESAVDSVRIISVIAGAGQGTVRLENNSKSLIYQPRFGYVGLDTLAYTIVDTYGQTSTAAVTVTVTASILPLAIDDHVTVLEDSGGLLIAPLINDLPNSGALVQLLSVLPTYGSVSLLGNQLLYIPPPQFHGQEIIGYHITDSSGPPLNTPEAQDAAFGRIIVDVLPVVDAMLLNTPKLLDVHVGQLIRFADHAANGFGLNDPDSSEHTYRVNLAVSSGKLILTAGLLTNSVSGNGTKNLEFSGTIDTVNKALSLLAFAAGNTAGQQTMDVAITSLDSDKKIVATLRQSVKISISDSLSGFPLPNLLPAYQSLPINLNFESEILTRKLSNGNTLLASTTNVGTQSDLLFSTYDAQGQLVPAFGGVGLATLNLGDNEVLADVVANHLGGFFALVYEPLSRFNRVSVIAFLSDGTVDQSFGIQGIVSVYNFAAVPSAISFSPQGQIFVSGAVEEISGTFGFVYGLTSDGRQIKDFGSNGLVLFSEPITTHVADNEKRLVLGSANKVYRLHPNGALDRTFDFDGQLDLPVNSVTKQILVAKNGDLTLIGQRSWSDANGSSGVEVALHKFHQDGSKDIAFGITGSIGLHALSPDESLSVPGSVTVDEVGRLIVAAAASEPLDTASRLLRLLPGGQLDTSFGEGGIERLPLASQGLVIAATHILMDTGRIAVGGLIGEVFSNQMGLLILTNDGKQVDNPAGVSHHLAHVPGTAELSFQSRSAPDGAVWVIGLHRGLPSLWRFDVFGQFDTDFGQQGFVQLDPILDYFATNTLIRFANDGTAYLTSSASAELIITKIKPDGKIDSSFGTNGKVTIRTSQVGIASGQLNLLDSTVDGSARLTTLIAVDQGLPSHSDLIFRLNPSGTFDSGFGTSGVSKLGPFPQASQMSKLVLGTLGELWVAGTIDVQEGDILVAKLDPFGKLDRGYSFDGINSYDPLNGNVDSVMALSTHSEGGLLIAASGFDSLISTSYLLVIDSAGAVSTRYGTSGRTLLAVPNADTQVMVRSMIQDSLGRTLVVGQVEGLRPFGFVARLTASGILDSTFSVDGYATGITLSGTELQEVHETSDGNLRASGLSSLKTGVWLIGIGGYTPVSITGIQWHDLNANGTRDLNEPTLANATTYLDLNENGKLNSGEPATTTDSHGKYEFRNMRPGTYRVAVVPDEVDVQPAHPIQFNLPAGVMIDSAFDVLFKSRDGSVLPIPGKLIGGKIEVVVPPLIDVDRMSFISGYVDIFLSTNAGEIQLAGDVRIRQLPMSTLAVGSVTNAYLELARQLTVAAFHQVTRIDSALGSVNFSDSTSRYRTILSELTQGSYGLRQIMADPNARISLGSFGGIDAQLNRAALAISDSLILAYLNPTSSVVNGEGENGDLDFLNQIEASLINTNNSALAAARPHLERMTDLFVIGTVLARVVAAGVGAPISLPAALFVGALVATAESAVSAVVTGLPTLIANRLIGKSTPTDLVPFIDYAVTTLATRVVKAVKIQFPKTGGGLHDVTRVIQLLANNMANPVQPNLLRELQQAAPEIPTRVGNEGNRLVMIDSESDRVSSAGGSTQVSSYFTGTINGSGTISYSVSDATEGQVSPNSFSFNSPRPYELYDTTVIGVDDGDSTATQFSITGSVQSNDLSVDGQTASLVINNSPEAAHVLVLPPAEDVLSESGEVQFIDVRLSSPPQSGNVTLPVLSTRPDKAKVSPPQLVFTASNWNVEQRITVTAQEDDLVDGDQQFVVRIDDPQSSDPRYASLGALDVPFVHGDNDVPPGIVIEPNATLMVSEQGTADRFRVHLASAPQGDVTLQFRPTLSREAKVEPATFTFNATNWDQDVQVLVTGLDDTEVDGDIAFPLMVEVLNTNDPKYARVNSEIVQVINQDNEGAPDLYIQMQFSSYTIDSGDTVNAQITVGNRGRVNASQVRVDMSIFDVSDAFPASFSLGGVACILSPRRTIATCNLPTLGAGEILNSSITFTPFSSIGITTVFVTGTISSEPYDSYDTGRDNVFSARLEVQPPGRGSGEDDASNTLGWRTSSPQNQNFQLKTLYDGEDSDTISFGRYRPASVSGIAFDDRDRNGRRDVHEALLSNYQVSADLNNNGRYEVGEPSTLALSDGNYLLSSILPGVYHILVTPDAGNSSTIFDMGAVELNSASAIPLMVAVSRPNPWRNPLNRFDINASGSVSPIDALLVINQLNLGNRGVALPVPIPQNSHDMFYFDVSDDGIVSPLDALLVINILNSRAGGEGELVWWSGPKVETYRTHDHPIDSIFDHAAFTTFWDDLYAKARSTRRR